MIATMKARAGSITGIYHSDLIKSSPQRSFLKSM